VGSDRAPLREWQPYKDLFAEIQVRTVVQHAWATVSHSLQYKREADVPIPLRRRLARVSALLELADMEFSAISEQHAGLDRELREGAKSIPTEWDAPIDYSSIVVFLDEDPEVQALSSEALEAGFVFDGSATADDESLPDLIDLCDFLGIHYISDLRQAIVSGRDRRIDYFSALTSTSTGGWTASPVFLVTLLTIRANISKITVEDLVWRDWGTAIAQRVIDAAFSSTDITVSDLDP
jgi:putative GTP pyrophosphokinase